MNWICGKCNEEVDATAHPERCPHCGAERGDLPPVSTLAVSDAQETVADDATLGVPTISAVEEGDETLLVEGVMTPPSRPGIRGNLGRFELLKVLGRGAMGHVYLAREPMTDTAVAVKVLRSELRRHEKVVKYFLAEARHMYAMSHPHVLKVLEVSESDQGPFFVMPYVSGGSLRARLKRGRPMERNDILPIALQVADGLAYAHSRGLIHRDLKPDNILIGERGEALVSDFGLVRTVFNDSVLDPDQKRAEGTPAYMSPGVAAGQAEDTRCDIYSLGAVLYEMLTGSLPYSGENVEEILSAIRSGPPLPVLKMAPDADKGLVRICEAAMARELRDRYATMDDVRADLERIRDGQKPVGPHAQAVRRKLAPTPLRVAAGLAVLAALAFGVSRILNSEPGSGPAPATPEPVSADALEDSLAAGLAALEAEDFPEAERLLAEVVQHPPVPVEAWRGLGDAYLAQTNTLSARISYDRVLRVLPNDTHSVLGLAHALKMERRFAPYTNFLLRAQRIEPQNPDIAGELIDHLLTMGHYGPARNTVAFWEYYNPGDARAAAWTARIEKLEAAGGVPPGPGSPPPTPRSPAPAPPASQPFQSRP